LFACFFASWLSESLDSGGLVRRLKIACNCFRDGTAWLCHRLEAALPNDSQRLAAIPRGDAMYLGMVVPSEKVIELLGDHARGAYRMVDQGRIKPWDDKEIFRDQFPDCVFDKNELMMSVSTSPGTKLDFVYSVKDGDVFCTFWPDSSLDP